MANEAARGLQNTVVYKWEYADAAERTGATGFAATDVGSLALQQDTNALYMLTDDSPVTWVLMTSTGATGAAGGVLSGTYPNPGFAADMATQAELDAHITDTADAHDASAISFDVTGLPMVATDVQGAIDELSGDIEGHIADATAAHAATAISFSPAGTIAATTVQAAIEEVASEAGGGGFTQEQIEDFVGAMFTGGTHTSLTATYQDAGGTIDLAVTGGGGGAPTTSKYITAAADATLSNEIVIPGLAGSADIASAAGAGTSEEFDGSDPFTYSPSSPNSVDVNTTVKSHYHATITDATVRFATKAWAPGSGAFDARACVSVGSNHGTNAPNAIFLLVTNTALTSYVIIGLGNDVTSNSLHVTSYTFTGGSFTQRGTTRTVHSNKLYLRITRDGSNNVAFYWSTDGNTWIATATGISFTFTVDRLGFRLYSGAAGTHIFASDWLRTSV